MIFSAVTLLTPDPDGARAFYGALGVDLPVVLLPDAARLKGAPPHWLGALPFDDDTRAPDALLRAGATPRGPTKFADPFGAVFALTNATATVSGLVRCDHYGPDPEGAARFYSPWCSKPADGASRLQFQSPSITFHTTADQPTLHPHWLFSFATSDLHASLTTVSDEGGEVISDLSAVHNMAVCHDPNGAIFALAVS